VLEDILNNRSAASLLGSTRNTYDIKNTPEGVVRMCRTGLLFSVRGTHTALKTHQRLLSERDAQVCCFFTRQYKEDIQRFKHIEGCCKNVLHKHAVSLTGSARNTNGIKSTRGFVKCVEPVIQSTANPVGKSQKRCKNYHRNQDISEVQPHQKVTQQM
jgi:hypothetical protein